MKSTKKLTFLHVADLHLDARKYNSEERTKDFFLALKDVLEKYAVAKKVSFVLFVGDLLDKRNVTAQGMNHAVECFQLLKNANIPAILVEGNHDQGSNFESSWLKSLNKWKFVKLLEPVFTEKGAELLEWDETRNIGSYIDIKGIRIYGNIWYGSSGDSAVSKIMDALRDVHDPRLYSIMMLHTDLDGEHKNIKGLSVDKMKELKTYINYLALGHIHRNFVIDDWAYSPGSLEPTAIDQYEVVRGAYLVEVDLEKKTHKPRLMREYRQRPFIRLSFTISEDTPEKFNDRLFDFLNSSLIPSTQDMEGLLPIVELTISGSLSFKTNLLNLNKIRDRIKKEYKCLLVLIKNQTKPIDFQSEMPDDTPRSEKERRVLFDLVSKDIRFKDKSDKLTDIIFEAKRLALSGELPEKIAGMIEKNM